MRDHLHRASHAEQVGAEHGQRAVDPTPGRSTLREAFAPAVSAQRGMVGSQVWGNATHHERTVELLGAVANGFDGLGADATVFGAGR